MLLQRLPDLGVVLRGQAVFGKYNDVHAAQLMLQLPKGLSRQPLDAVALHRQWQGFLGYRQPQPWMRQAVGTRQYHQAGGFGALRLCKYLTELLG